MAQKKNWLIGWRWFDKPFDEKDQFQRNNNSLKEVYDFINLLNTSQARDAQPDHLRFFYFLKGEAK